MQHTDKYNFNLIDADDPFSPDALNKNTQKLEDALVTHEAVVDSALKAQKLEWQAADAALDGKLSAEAAARTAEDARLDAAKAEKTALSAETAAREAALTALAGRVGTLEQGRLVYKLDTYTGDGTVGTTNPTRLEFDFKPLLLIVSHSTSSMYGGRVWIRGTSSGRTTHDSSGNTRHVRLTWEDRAVEWVNNLSTDTAEYRLNANKVSYCYLAIGILE